MTQAAEQAGVPLVYVNREPVNVDELPMGQAFVASDERESGTLETQEICRLLQLSSKSAIETIVSAVAVVLRSDAIPAAGSVFSFFSRGVRPTSLIFAGLVSLADREQRLRPPARPQDTGSSGAVRSLTGDCME